MRVVSLMLWVLMNQALASPAGELAVERVDLGEGPQEQAYNLQERGDMRVFARSRAGFRQARIYQQRRVAGQWQREEAMPFSDARWRDSDPHLSADGRALTFSSDRPAEGAKPMGHLDLYESRMQDGRWRVPQRLPERWQSPAYELGPERYGDTVYLASYREGGPGKLAIYAADSPDAAPQALPAPINVGAANSDFTLTPDGRHALWWSDRAGKDGGPGDLYVAERLGAGFGPALRLPASVNGPGFEFTPSVSADGQWLFFASTRGDASGLAHVYRVAWPAVLDHLGASATAHSQAALDAAVSTLWRAIGHAPGQASDVRTLATLLHPEARVFGQRLTASSLRVQADSAQQFLAVMAEPGDRGLYECEVERQQRRFGGHAQVYSVVETRRDLNQPRAAYTGGNSMQWQLGPQGWQLLSLHYALELPGLKLQAEPPAGLACLSPLSPAPAPARP